MSVKEYASQFPGVLPTIAVDFWHPVCRSGLHNRSPVVGCSEAAMDADKFNVVEAGVLTASAEQ